MLKLNVTEGQDIDRALRDKANKPFIDDFLKTVPDNERANLLTRNGELNQMGLYRAKAAIYTRAFPRRGAANDWPSRCWSRSTPRSRAFRTGLAARCRRLATRPR